MMRLIVASNNINKINEIKDILKKLPVEILSMKDAGIGLEIEENGATFIENALIKAKAIHELIPDAMVLSDDSGLSVDVLGGAPGIYSARFSGEHGNDKKNNEKLLTMLKGEINRSARFICAMVLITEKGEEIKVQGEIKGTISEEETGTNGFGYDPIFYLEEYNRTFAEVESEIKNKISHRAKALAKIQHEITEIIRG
ncbi:MAG: XTP/dITP diphosphatase [Solirubrobacterales bacterium]